MVAAAHAAGRVRVGVVNASWRAAPWADWLYAADGDWWDHEAGAPGFRGEKWTASTSAAARWGLGAVTLRVADGISAEPGVLHHGGHSGFQALGLAVARGARRIVLLGYDLRAGPGGRMHWHGVHPAPLRNPSPEALARWAGAFPCAAADLARMGVTVINASRRTALTCFERQPIEAALGGG